MDTGAILAFVAGLAAGALVLYLAIRDRTARIEREWDAQMTVRERALASSMGENSAKGNRILELEAELERLKGQEDRFASMADDKSSALTEAQEQLADVARELTVAEARLHSLEAERLELQQRQRLDLGERDAAIQSLETRLASTVSRTDAELASLEAQLERRQKRISELERQLDSLLVPPAPREPEPNVSRRDNLKKIRGIGPVLERRLNDIGVLTFDDLAGLTPTEFDVIARDIPGTAKSLSNWKQEASEKVRFRD